MHTLFTIGHSTRSFDEFLALLRENGIRALIDVRRYPASRRYPHFNGAMLAQALKAADIDYDHAEDLGGRRAALPQSPNGAWRNASFRGYADHMDTPAFRASFDRVMAQAGRMPAVVMCAEAVPWRCHRNLIADAAVAQGARVTHIIGPGQRQEHRLHEAAHVRGDGTIMYPAREAQLELEEADGL